MTIGGGGGAHNHSSQSQGGKTLTSHLPPGTEITFMGTGQPGANADDFLEENGQNVSRTGVTAALFAAIGTTWGVGDGSTTFGLPDARRRSSVGKGGVGTAALGATAGSTGGEESHVETGAESGLQSHAHNVQGFSPDSGATELQATTVGGTLLVNQSTGGAGPASGAAQNTYHPAYVCGKWIKT